MSHSPQSVFSRLCRQFDGAASTYLKAAKLQEASGTALLQRLDLLRNPPFSILDLGAGPCQFSGQLQRRYPKAEVVALDCAHSMLLQMPRRLFRRQPKRVAADMHRLPFADNSFDLIFSNQVIHWTDNLKALLLSLSRSLKAQGAFVFATLGPDTFKEIRHAWQQVDAKQHTLAFKDMHDVGDALNRFGFTEPVVDMSMMTLRYRSVKRLCQDLKAQGVQMSAGGSGLTTPGMWKNFEQCYEQYRDAQGWLPLTYEVVYGIAFRRIAKPASTESLVPLANIQRRFS